MINKDNMEMINMIIMKLLVMKNLLPQTLPRQQMMVMELLGMVLPVILIPVMLLLMLLVMVMMLLRMKKLQVVKLMMSMEHQDQQMKIMELLVSMKVVFPSLLLRVDKEAGEKDQVLVKMVMMVKMLLKYAQEGP